MVPASFQTAIARTFYDKTVTKLQKIETVDSEGGVQKAGTTPVSTFKGNVRFNNLGEVQTEMGLTHEIDIAITCAPDTPVEVDDLLEYAGVKYVAVSVIPNDSHKLIVGTRWLVQ